jgi:dTDP-4-dehydrorhamnose 3,5-epimerase-like enzyme
MTKLIKLPQFRNSSGTISVIEKLFKFKIKRVYFIHDIKGKRGGHKHKKTRQFLICAQGSCEILIKNKKKEQLIKLSKINYGILLEPEDWHEIINCSSDALIVVLASENYKKNDYIYNY